MTDQVHLVVVTQPEQDGRIMGDQLWIAATPLDEAVAAVQRELQPGWTARLADHAPSKELVERLRLAPGTVSELTEASRAAK
ncbi:hypothetical protein [Bosea thiooxidans]